MNKTILLLGALLMGLNFSGCKENKNPDVNPVVLPQSDPSLPPATNPGVNTGVTPPETIAGGNKELVVQYTGFGEVAVEKPESRIINFTNSDSAHEIEIIDIKIVPDLGYYVIQAHTCNKIGPLASCGIPVEFNPTEAMLNMPDQPIVLEISYIINNRTEKTSITLNGRPRAKDAPEILVSFPNTTKNLVSKGTLTIINNSDSEAITDIKIEGLPSKKVEVTKGIKQFQLSIFNYMGADFDDTNGAYPGPVGPVSCPADGTLPKDFCEITLRAERNNQLGERVEPIMVSFTFRGQKITKEVKLSSTIVDRKELYAGQPHFISKGLNKEAKLKFPFSVTNLSNLHEVNNIVIRPAPNSAFKLPVDQVANIKPKSPAHPLALTYKPTVAGPAITETWEVDYDIGEGADLEQRTTQFNVSAAATTAPGALEITGYDFGKKTIIAGDVITIRLNLQNPTAAEKGKRIEDLKLVPEGGAWDGDFDLLNSSTCVANADLDEGQNCYYDINLKLAVKNQKYNRRLILSYDNKKTEIKFNLHGDVDILPVGTVLTQTMFPEVIKADNKIDDPFFPYIKRPLVSNAAMLYPDAVIKRIPNDTRQPVQTRTPYFIPWTFKNAWHNGAVTELGKIVPDRIKDKTGKDYLSPSGNTYVKLYHGSAAKYKTGFLTQGVAFNKGVRNAYGQGFYLTADINEAKRYACDAAFGGDAIVLVVGVEDRPEVKGKSSYNGHQSDINTGVAYDDNIKFGVGHTNQFVFFTNSEKYMKFFTLVELPPKFGAADSIVEENGFGIGVPAPSDHSSHPDNDPHGRFRCN